MFATINPATSELVAQFEPCSRDGVEAALTSAVRAQRDWRSTPIRERSQLLTAVAAVLRERKERYAALITLEMGKPIVEAEAEIEKCAMACEFYADQAAGFLADQPVATNAWKSGVSFDPLGVVLGVMPWNYPFWQVLRFAAPALAAGNAAILKHANNVPQCALALQEVFRDAGAPKGLFLALLVEASEVKELIEDRRVAAVTLTGSTPVGKLIAAQAGAVLKKQVLELGGSDPFIVLADADIEMAAKVGAKARFQNAGQSCICAKRFIVEEAISDRFVEALRASTQEIRVGDPMKRSTGMGPMARRDLRADLHGLVQRTVQQGGRLVLGGRLTEGPGAYYSPTIIDHVTGRMAGGSEETFGPVASVLRVGSMEQALELANATDYGLGAGLWTRDMERAERLARQIDAGAVFVNGIVASDPRLPFGGIKQSGYGRELGSYGIREFTNIKTLWIGSGRSA